MANNELAKLSDWFAANKLSINIKKSNFMMFRSRQKRQTLDGLKVCLCNNEINRVKEIVFLGVVIDEHLTWIPHISNVTRKISKAVGIMYKASFCLNKRALLTLYYSLVYPYLQYCVSVWGSTYHTNLHRLILLQKKAVRIISNKSFDAHTDPFSRRKLWNLIIYIYFTSFDKIMYLKSILFLSP